MKLIASRFNTLRWIGFGFKPFAVCLIAYVWLKVVWTKVGLTIEANESLKDIQKQVVELRCRD